MIRATHADMCGTKGSWTTKEKYEQTVTRSEALNILFMYVFPGLTYERNSEISSTVFTVQKVYNFPVVEVRAIVVAESGRCVSGGGGDGGGIRGGGGGGGGRSYSRNVGRTNTWYNVYFYNYYESKNTGIKNELIPVALRIKPRFWNIATLIPKSCH